MAMDFKPMMAFLAVAALLTLCDSVSAEAETILYAKPTGLLSGDCDTRVAACGLTYAVSKVSSNVFVIELQDGVYDEHSLQENLPDLTYVMRLTAENTGGAIIENTHGTSDSPFWDLADVDMSTTGNSVGFYGTGLVFQNHNKNMAGGSVLRKIPNLQLTDCIFRNNTVSKVPSISGEITTTSGLVTAFSGSVVGCEFRDNFVHESHKGLLSFDGTEVISDAQVTIQDSVFENNTGAGRSTLFLHSLHASTVTSGRGTMTINNVTFTGNTAGGAGAISGAIDSTLVIENSTFNNNKGDFYSEEEIEEIELTGIIPVAEATAGAISVEVSDVTTIQNVTMDGNVGYYGHMYIKHERDTTHISSYRVNVDTLVLTNGIGAFAGGAYFQNIESTEIVAVELRAVEVKNNKSYGTTGGLVLHGGHFTVSGFVNVAGNYAGLRVGGVKIDDAFVLFVGSNEFSIQDNVSGKSVGGLEISCSTSLTLAECKEAVNPELEGFLVRRNKALYYDQLELTGAVQITDTANSDGLFAICPSSSTSRVARCFEDGVDAPPRYVVDTNDFCLDNEDGSWKTGGDHDCCQGNCEDPPPSPNCVATGKCCLTNPYLCSCPRPSCGPGCRGTWVDESAIPATCDYSPLVSTTMAVTNFDGAGDVTTHTLTIVIKDAVEHPDDVTSKPLWQHGTCEVVNTEGYYPYTITVSCSLDTASFGNVEDFTLDPDTNEYISEFTWTGVIDSDGEDINVSTLVKDCLGQIDGTKVWTDCGDCKEPEDIDTDEDCGDAPTVEKLQYKNDAGNPGVKSDFFITFSLNMTTDSTANVRSRVALNRLIGLTALQSVGRRDLNEESSLFSKLTSFFASRADSTRGPITADDADDWSFGYDYYGEWSNAKTLHVIVYNATGQVTNSDTRVYVRSTSMREEGLPTTGQTAIGAVSPTMVEFKDPTSGGDEINNDPNGSAAAVVTVFDCHTWEIIGLTLCAWVWIALLVLCVCTCCCIAFCLFRRKRRTIVNHTVYKEDAALLSTYGGGTITVNDNWGDSVSDLESEIGDEEVGGHTYTMGDSRGIGVSSKHPTHRTSGTYSSSSAANASVTARYEAEPSMEESFGNTAGMSVGPSMGRAPDASFTGGSVAHSSAGSFSGGSGFLDTMGPGAGQDEYSLNSSNSRSSLVGGGAPAGSYVSGHGAANTGAASFGDTFNNNDTFRGRF